MTWTSQAFNGKQVLASSGIEFFHNNVFHHNFLSLHVGFELQPEVVVIFGIWTTFPGIELRILIQFVRVAISPCSSSNATHQIYQSCQPVRDFCKQKLRPLPVLFWTTEAWNITLFHSPIRMNQQTTSSFNHSHAMCAGCLKNTDSDRKLPQTNNAMWKSDIPVSQFMEELTSQYTACWFWL